MKENYKYGDPKKGDVRKLVLLGKMKMRNIRKDKSDMIERAVVYKIIEIRRINLDTSYC